MAPRKPIKRPRGRPRDEDTDRAIRRAALTLLHAGINLTAETIAKAGEVGKPTIYRRLRGDHLPDFMAFVEPTMQAELLSDPRPPGAAALCGRVAGRLTSPAQRRVIAHLLREPTRLTAYLQPVTRALRISLASRADADAVVADLVALTLGASLSGAEPDVAQAVAVRLATARLVTREP